jgi:sulfate adenylyltransferase subunit 1
MVTAASTANLAIILVDARKGVVAQTRRHSYIAHLLGIPHLIVAINKMDLVDYDAERFEAIRRDYLAFAAEYGITDVHFIPLSALNGDMVVDRGERLDWYDGPTLLEVLEKAPPAHSEHDEAFRFPVQFVMRPQRADDPGLHDYRGFMGRIESGTVRVGDVVTVLPSGQRSRILSLERGALPVSEAFAEESVSIQLEDDIDISRGDMIVHAEGPQPRLVKELTAELCWLSERPLDRQRKYLVRHTSREVKALVASIEHRIDMGSLAALPAQTLAMNDIAKLTLRLAQPLAVDNYGDNRGTGCFILIDETNNNTVAAGLIDLA